MNKIQSIKEHQNILNRIVFAKKQGFSTFFVSACPFY